MNEREQRIARRMDTCTHFTGIQHDECKAGVPYDYFRLADGSLCLPCLPPVVKGRPQVFGCDSKTLPTREEADAREAEIDATFAHVITARDRVMEQAHATGSRQGMITCPACGQVLRYAVASNGHVSGRCARKGCLAWME